MKLEFNVTGKERKALVLAVSQITNQPLNYKGAPTFAFEVGEYTIDKTGTLTGPDNRDLEDALGQQDFIADAETREYDGDSDSAADEPAEETVTETPDIGETITEGDTLAIEMPLEGHTDESIANLEKLIASKAGLIKKALGAETLTVEKEEHRLRFPWFRPGLDAEDFTAYAWFISALCKAAKEQKRVTAKEKPVDNEKFCFRVFLIRLGFIGDDYKNARKVLLRNLTGNSAFKSGKPPERTENSAETTEVPGMDSLEEALADAEYIHAVNASFETEGADTGMDSLEEALTDAEYIHAVNASFESEGGDGDA